MTCAFTQSDQSLLVDLWVAQDQNFLQPDSEDSGKTGQMPRLIGVFAGCTDDFFFLFCFVLVMLWLILYM